MPGADLVLINVCGSHRCENCETRTKAVEFQIGSENLRPSLACHLDPLAEVLELGGKAVRGAIAIDVQAPFVLREADDPVRGREAVRQGIECRLAGGWTRPPEFFSDLARPRVIALSEQ